MPLPDENSIRDSSPHNLGLVSTEFVTQRELQTLKEISLSEMGGLRDKLEARLDAIDKATELLSVNINRVPTILDREIDKVDALVNERFASVSMQFAERDVRTDQDKLAATTAVNAALQAQKEAAGASAISNAAAITKSEAGFTRDIEGIKTIITSNRDGLSLQIADIVARLNRSEAAALNTRDVHTDQRMTIGAVVGAIGGVVGIISLIASLGFIVSHGVGASSQQVPPVQVQVPATGMSIPAIR